MGPRFERLLTACAFDLICGCGAPRRPPPAASSHDAPDAPPRATAPAGDAATGGSSPAAPDAPAAVTATPSPCVVAATSPADACAPGAACAVRDIARLECRARMLAGPAAQGAGRAAVAWLGDSAGLVEFAPRSAPRAREVFAGPVLTGALAATREGGYRLVAADASSPRIVAVGAAGPAQGDAAASTEWIAVADTRAVEHAFTAGDGRTHALLADGSSPGPLRLLTRELDGRWSDRLVSGARVARPWLLADASGRPVVAFAESTARPPYFALRAAAEAAPVATVGPGVDGEPFTAALVGGATRPAVGYASTREARIALPGADGRVLRTLAVPTRGDPDDVCTDPPVDPRALRAVTTCRTTGLSGGRFVLVGGPGDVLWVLSAEQRYDIDQRVETSCHPVDPPGRAPRGWVPPPNCEVRLTPTADRSVADLVVRSVSTGRRGSPLDERARLRLPLPAAARQLAVRAARADGVLHVLVAGRLGQRATGAYLALDEAPLAQ